MSGTFKGLTQAQIDRRLNEGRGQGQVNRPGFSEPLHSVHHPKESSSGAKHARVSDWRQRIRAALK